MNARSKLSSVSLFGFAGAICVVAATRVETFEYFLLWFSGGFGAASGAIYIAALSVAADTHMHKIATPSMVAAFGAGGAIFGPTWRLLDAGGWGLDSLALLALGLFISSLLVAKVCDDFRPIHTSRGAQPKTNPELRGSATTLIMIWLIFAFGSFGGLMVLGLASKMMDFAQTSVVLASFGLAGMAIGNTAGRLSVTWLSSHLRSEQCLVGAMSLTLIGLWFAIMHVDPLVLCIGLILIATGYGIVASTVPVLTRAAFGPEQFQRRFALVFTGWGVAGFLAPWAGGALFDQFGSFYVALLLAVVAVILCCVVSWRLGLRLGSGA